MDSNLAELSKNLAETREMVLSGQTALNIVWTLITGFLVMFMQAGFALVETGLTRAKNVAHTMGMNFLVYSIGIIGFWALGFALQMGGVGPMPTFGNDPTLSSEMIVNIGGKAFGLFGMHGFFLSPAVYTAPVAALFLFQMVFMDTAATIPTGAMAERWSFTSFVIFSFVISTIMYPIYANWVWGGGWLSQLGVNFGLGHGHVDFAGSSVVHMVGGVAALVGAKMLGPRIGKYAPDGKRAAHPGAQHPDGGAGHVHPRVRLVRLQPGLDAVGHRHAHRDHRRQHHARVGVGRVWRLSLFEAPLRHARRQHALQRDARRAWSPSPRPARSSRRRQPSSSASSPACWWSSRRCSSRTC